MRTFVLRIRSRRRGMAMVLVLCLLALTLGLSYALLRTHTADHELERNQARKVDARTASQAGMAIALRKLYDGSWAGADTTFAGDLTTDKLQGFTVTYTTGDGTLTSSSSDWNEYPFRLTIDSVGYSIDSITSASRSQYTIRTVVQMIRRKLNTNQATTGLEGYSVYQTSNNNARIHHPIRLNGNVYLQGQLDFSVDYPLGHQGATYMTYFDQLRTMYAANNAWDYRPFSGRLYTPTSRQPNGSDVVQVLDPKLQVPRTDVPISSAAPVTVVGNSSTYRLFDKGKSYSMSAIAATADSSNVVPSVEYLVTPGTYASDPKTNPLGIYVNTRGRLGVYSNTTLQGTLIAPGNGSSADVHIGGSNIKLQGTLLPALSGDATSYCLPAIMAGDDVRIYDGTDRTITGWIVATDEFQLEPGDSSTTVTSTGGVICSKLYLDERTSWSHTALEWTLANTLFGLDLAKSGQNLYFPGWLNTHNGSWGIYLTPRLIFNPTPDGVKNHVPDFSQPIYIAHPDDGALLWDVIRWTEVGAT